MTAWGVIVRFIVAALVLMLIGYVVPGFGRLTFGEALMAAVVISVAGWLLELAFGHQRVGRGIVGFIVSAVVIYFAQYVVPGMAVTVLGAIIAAFVIGLVDTVVPTTIH